MQRPTKIVWQFTDKIATIFLLGFCSNLFYSFFLQVDERYKNYAMIMKEDTLRIISLK